MFLAFAFGAQAWPAWRRHPEKTSLGSNMKLLHIDSSISGSQSVSRQLTASIVARLRQTTPSLEITYRDLAAMPVPHHSGGTAEPQIQSAF